MANYEGENCSKCGKPFQPGDDIVVCPDCGAPYHRSCSKEISQCVYHDKHGTEEAYQPKEERERKRAAEEGRRVDGRAELRCSRCGSLNPADGLFCEVCGTPLKKQVENQQEQNAQNVGQGNYGQTGGFPPFGQQPYHTIPYNPFTTPFGGLNPDEEIDGVPVKDLAIFLGQNSHYFLPRFKQMKERNGNTWNWSACILQQYYLLYRKMNLLGVLMFLLSIVLSLPGILGYFDVFRQLYSPDAAAVFDANMLMIMSYVFSFLSMLVRIFFGMFFNRLYMNQVFRKVRKIREEYGNRPEYHSMLLKNGSVSMTMVIAIIVATFTLSVASAFVMMAFMI